MRVRAVGDLDRGCRDAGNQGHARYQYLEIDGVQHRVDKEQSQAALNRSSARSERDFSSASTPRTACLHINGRQVGAFTLRPLSYKPTNVT